MRAWILAAALAAAAPAALAQAPAAPVRLTGAITAVTPASLTVKPASGDAATVALAKGYQVIIARPVNMATIKPGMYVATANTNIDASSGKSIELRMFDPSRKGAEFSRPMAAPNTTMTNGTVQSVKRTPTAWELSVYAPGGPRKIIVPNDLKVIGNFPGAPSDLKVGAAVTVQAAKDASGAMITGRVTVNRG